MTIGRAAALLTVVALMTAGQILFKLAAGRIGPLSADWATLRSLILNPYLVAGGLVYAVTTVLWVIVLIDGSLSRSYPFVALTMVLVPLAGLLLFNEPASWGLLGGGALILLGLAVISFT